MLDASPQPQPPADPDPQKSTPTIGINDVMKLDLRVGRVIEAREHPNADKLLILTVDIGDDEPRTLVAGIKAAYAPDSLVNQLVVVVANLKPAVLRGVTSEGMLLAGSDASGLSIIQPERPLTPGAKVK